MGRDERFLEGDPREETVCTIDLTPFAAWVHQESALMVELFQAGRTEELFDCAVSLMVKAEGILRTTETPKLPQVDIDRTPDVHTGRRAYKGQ